MSTGMNHAREVLFDVFTRALASGKLDANDTRIVKTLRLSHTESRDLYDALLQTTWGDVIDDDALSERECAGLGAIGVLLSLPPAALPRPAIRLAQAG